MKESSDHNEESYGTKDDLAKAFLELHGELFEKMNENNLEDKTITLKNEFYEIKLKRLK